MTFRPAGGPMVSPVMLPRLEVRAGAGGILGERAVLEQGLRTATLRAATDCVVAATAAGAVDVDRLRDLERLHHREDTAD
jgi:CRP-like cAMP-binding protein